MKETIQQRVVRIERTSSYTISDRDAFLEAVCEQLIEDGGNTTAEELSDAQIVYSLEECQQFIEENS